MHFCDRLTELAAQRPEQVVLDDGDRRLTRAELESQVNRTARYFTQLGVTAGDTVTISVPSSVGLFVTAIATWKLGATPNLLFDRLPDNERGGLIELADPALAVGMTAAQAGGRAALPADYPVPESCGDDPFPAVRAPIWKAMASGGSTGRPKLIVADQPADTETLAGFREFLGMPADGVQLVTASLAHNGPFLYATCGLLAGSELVIMKRFDAAEALRLIEQRRADFIYAVPTMMSRIWALPEPERQSRDLTSLVTLVHTAAPCPPWLKRAFIDWLGADRILETYGGTEAQAATSIRGEEWLRRPGSVGQVRFGEMVSLDADGEPVAPGEVGEIWMRRDASGATTYHYVGADARSRPGGWQSIGDMGSWDEEGYLFVADRTDDMIIRGGANIYPAEVEGVLQQHPAVDSACVVGMPDDDLGAVPYAIVNVSEEVSDEELTRFLRERLLWYKVPTAYERVEEPLHTEVGKLQRYKLRDERLPR